MAGPGLYNLNANYGMAQAAALPYTTGKVFFVSDAADTTNFNGIDGLYVPDAEGTQRRYSTFTAALAASVTGRGDLIMVSPNFTTALTAAELLSAETKGVQVYRAGLRTETGLYVAYRATATLPQTTQSALFTVTGRIRLLDIQGVVTTVVQTQANNTKIVANPTVGADVDMCAVLDITAAAVGSVFSITGTLATAMVKTVSGVGVYQAASQTVEAGTIDLSCAASNTGSVKWSLRYMPIDPGAIVVAA